MYNIAYYAHLGHGSGVAIVTRPVTSDAHRWASRAHSHQSALDGASVF